MEGENEGRIREADLRKAFLAKEQEAADEIKKLSADAAQKAREDFTNAQKQFNDAAHSMPGGMSCSEITVRLAILIIRSMI